MIFESIRRGRYLNRIVELRFLTFFVVHCGAIWFSSVPDSRVSSRRSVGCTLHLWYIAVEVVGSERCNSREMGVFCALLHSDRSDLKPNKDGSPLLNMGYYVMIWNHVTIRWFLLFCESLKVYDAILDWIQVVSIIRFDNITRVGLSAILINSIQS